MPKMNPILPSSQVSILGDPPKDVNLPQSAFLSASNVFPSGEMLFCFFFALCSSEFLTVCLLHYLRYSGKQIPACMSV